MIWTFLLSGVVSILNWMFSWLGPVTELPFDLGTYLHDGMGYIYFLSSLVPPIGLMLTGFLWIVGWKTTLLVLRLLHILN